MRNTLRNWIERWTNWVGDRSVEQAIRQQLQTQGHAQLGAKIRHFRLVAIQRPGWVCVYQFEIEANSGSGEAEKLFGVVRDDSRRKEVVRLFEHRAERNRLRDQWSEGLIIAPNVDRRD